MPIRTILLTTLAALLAACARDDAKPTSDTVSSPSTAQTNRCAPQGARITAGGVGVVKIGARLHDVVQQCTVRDTSITLGEGEMERAHVVSVGGGSIVALTTGTQDTSVTRVIIDDARYLTESGIGVGRTVGALRAAYGTLCEMTGEGNHVWLAASAPGISFGADSLRTPADSTVISKIWIVGNPARCGGG